MRARFPYTCSYSGHEERTWDKGVRSVQHSAAPGVYTVHIGPKLSDTHALLTYTRYQVQYNFCPCASSPIRDVHHFQTVPILAAGASLQQRAAGAKVALRPPPEATESRTTSRVCASCTYMQFTRARVYRTRHNLRDLFFLLGRVRIVFNEAKGASYSNSVFKNTGFFFPFLLSCKIRPQNSRIRFLSAAAFLDSIS